MVCTWLRRRSRGGLKSKLEAIAEKTDSEDIKAAIANYMDTYENGVSRTALQRPRW